MSVKTTILFLVLIVSGLGSHAQTITPQVINSAGDYRQDLGNSGVSLQDNIGEPFTQTVDDGNFRITQGFIQNYVIVPGFSLTILKNDVSCQGKDDGNISIVTNAGPTYSVSYFWSDTTICPTNNCSNVDSLKAGTYSVMAVIAYTTVSQPTVVLTHTINSAPIVIEDLNGPCVIVIYNGVTANGDKVNDVFYIKNITEYPLNRVTIYNRWGNLMFDANNYDNVNIYWPTQENLSTLASSTYFYVVDLGDGSKIYRGWVQLFKE